MRKLSDLDFRNAEITFGEETPMYGDRQARLPVIVNGVEMDVADVNFIVEPHIVHGKTLYQTHIFIDDELQHKGLGYNIYKSFVHEFGNIYSSHWCRKIYNEIISIFKKLAQEDDITVQRTSDYYLAYLNNQK